MIEVDDLVVFHTPYPDETDQVYRVLEINGDRCLVVAVGTGMPIPPSYVVETGELMVFQKGGS